MKWLIFKIMRKGDKARITVIGVNRGVKVRDIKSIEKLGRYMFYVARHHQLLNDHDEVYQFVQEGDVLCARLPKGKKCAKEMNVREARRFITSTVIIKDRVFSRRN